MIFLKRSFNFFLLVVFFISCSRAQTHVGRVLDDSSRHLMFSYGGTKLSQPEPRIASRIAAYRFEDSQGLAIQTFEESGPQSPVAPNVVNTIDGHTGQVAKNRKIDWSVPLGGGNVAPYQSPAKYGFDINSQPDCVNDYAVFGLNVPGVTNGQANVVGINQLYSGVNPTGLCGTTPHVNWAYNGSTAGGSILTSVAVSLDGTKIAYVESTANKAIFHVLTWKAGQGTSATTAAAPTQVGSCTASSSCLKSLTYSANFSTGLAPPWVDYVTDKVFVASDDGKIYRLSCAFTCGLNANPTLDWSFTLPVAGTGGAMPRPTAPTYDSNTGRLFVADQLGEVWVVDGAANVPTLLAGPVMVGGGGCTTTNPPGRTGTPNPCTANGGSYGIPDGVLIDVSGPKIFAFSGNDGAAASAVVVQMNEDLSGLIRDHVGLGSVGNTSTNVDLHDGSPDDNFFFGDPTQGHLFLCGTGPLNTTPYFYWIGFPLYPTMDTTPTRGPQRIPVAGAPCTPLTEFFNPNIDLGGIAGHHDLLMSGVIDPTNGFLITDDISAGNVALLNFANYPGGVSAVVLDNVSTQPQASSMYFSTLTQVTVGSCNNARCAVKLSQLNLQ